MRRWLFVLFLSLAMLAPGAVETRAQEGGAPGEIRVALVIANEAYVSRPAFQPLPGTQQDAAVMEPALRQAGFSEITVARNLGRDALRTALETLAARLEALGENGVGFLYYSGHGVGQNGDNWLIPIDANITSVTQLPTQALSLRAHLDALEIARAGRVIIVLDACRTTIGRGARGLVAVPATTRTLIAYSTYESSVADDNGLYARVLAEEMTRPGADSAVVFEQTKQRVAALTGEAQVPRSDNGFITPLVFVPEGGRPVRPEEAPDARQTPSDVRAPLVRSEDVTRLRDFAMFRECEDCPEMVVLPAGRFTMGSPDSEAHRQTAEGPQRPVNLRRFAIGRFELTGQEWSACSDGGGGCFEGATGRRRLPVAGVNWTDVQVYLSWLNTQGGGGTALVRDGVAGRYRLPSEAEWEYAVRAGTTTVYEFGDDPADLNEYAWYGANAERRSHEVGGKRANRFGLHDLHGNVSEWTQDCRAESYLGTPLDGSAHEPSPCWGRIYRGGSWDSFQVVLRSADRSDYHASVRTVDIGFRVARTLN